jgi:hypothetical protein
MPRAFEGGATPPDGCRAGDLCREPRLQDTRSLERHTRCSRHAAAILCQCPTRSWTELLIRRSPLLWPLSGTSNTRVGRAIPTMPPLRGMAKRVLRRMSLGPASPRVGRYAGEPTVHGPGAPIAHRVLVGAAAGNASGLVLVRTRVTPLKVGTFGPPCPRVQVASRRLALQHLPPGSCHRNAKPEPPSFLGCFVSITWYSRHAQGAPGERGRWELIVQDPASTGHS